MNLKKILYFVICLLLLGACKNSNKDGNARPGEILIGVYSGENPGQTRENIAIFQHYLEKEIGIKVTFYFTNDYTSLVEGIQRKKLDAVQLSPFSYVLATTKPCLIPLCTIGTHHVPIRYHSIIFVNSQSGILQWDDLKKNTKELTLCFADPASTSGHLLPRSYLRSQGMDPDTAFKQTVFAGSHAASIMSVVSGKIDVGCSSSDLALDLLVEQGLVKPNAVRILWTSPGIINDVICVRNDLAPEIRSKIQQAYFDVDKKDSNAFKGSVHRYYPHPVDMQFIPVSDSMYDGIRKVAGSINELKLNK